MQLWKIYQKDKYSDKYSELLNLQLAEKIKDRAKANKFFDEAYSSVEVKKKYIIQKYSNGMDIWFFIKFLKVLENTDIFVIKSR
jgi:hypothetical protein